MKIEQVIALLKDEKIALEERFIKASVLVDRLRKPLGISDAEQLKFYGFFKQGALGKCNYSIPGRLYVAKRELWKAWDDVKDMGKAEAQKAYIALGIQAIGAIKGDKASAIPKILDELTEAGLTNLAINKILISSVDSQSGKLKVCIVDQAKQISKVEELKAWSAVAESLKATLALSAPAKAATAVDAPAKPAIAFSAAGIAAASAQNGTGVAGARPSDLSAGAGAARATSAATQDADQGSRAGVIVTQKSAVAAKR